MRLVMLHGAALGVGGGGMLAVYALTRSPEYLKLSKQYAYW